jgi:cytochrome c oxidase subunit 3
VRAEKAGSFPAAPISTGKTALLLVLATESAFFLTVIVAYLALRGQVAWNVAHTLDRLALPLTNTGILLVSAVVTAFYVRAALDGRRRALKNGLAIAFLLGLLFVAGQVVEFARAGLHVDDPTFGGVFFTLISFHAAHLVAGMVFVAINLARARLGDFSEESHEPVQLGAWFWYYVIGVWLVLFAVLYLL